MKYTRNSKEVLNRVCEAIQSGRLIKEVAAETGISYQHILNCVRGRGISGGTRQKDMRPLTEKIREAIRIDAEGHWFWRGRHPRNMTNLPGVRTPRNAARYLAGLPAVRESNMGRHVCEKPKCINPEHLKLDRFAQRNREIVARWHQSEEAKKVVVTLEDLGRQYGLTRERIRQIVGKGSV